MGDQHGSSTTSEPVVFPRPARADLALAALLAAALPAVAARRAEAAPSRGAHRASRRRADAAAIPARRRTGRAIALAAGVVAVMLVAGCGGSDDAASPAGALTISFSPSGDGGDARELELGCDPPAGTVPDPADACAALEAMEDPFAPVPASTACTELYGGPQVITVRGTWSGRPVDARLTRVDGCEIERYDRLAGPLGIAALTPEEGDTLARRRAVVTREGARGKPV